MTGTHDLSSSNPERFAFRAFDFNLIECQMFSVRKQSCCEICGVYYSCVLPVL